MKLSSNTHRRHGAATLALVTALTLLSAQPGQAQTAPASPAPVAKAPQSRNLAPGFAGMGRDQKVLVMPVDVELFSLSAGGVAEPKADWTATAAGHLRTALHKRVGQLGLKAEFAEEALADEFGEQVGLHAAVAESIALHHGVGGVWSLPTKNGQLLWSFEDAMQGLQARSGARYGLFVWVRDSYASAERKAAMVAMALFGVGLTAGIQVGYASLVDLQTGQVLWFNRLARGTGDLREAEPAEESVAALLAELPAAR